MASEQPDIPGIDDARAAQAQQQRRSDELNAPIPERGAEWDELGPSQKLEKLRFVCETSHTISLRLMELVAEMGRSIEILRAHSHDGRGSVVVPIAATEYQGGAYGDLNNLLQRIKRAKLF